MIEAEAKALTEFLKPMLSWYPEKRATAEQMLAHPWLSMGDNDRSYMTDR